MTRKLIISCIIFFALHIGYSQSTQEGRKSFRYERYITAITQLEKAVATNPNDLEGWYWLTRSYAQSSQPDQAEATLNKIPAGLQEQPLYKVVQGLVALQKNDTARAKDLFIAAIGNARKKDPAIQLAVAEINIDLPKGNIPYALQLLEEAAKRDSKNPAIYIARGDAYRKLYNGSEAVKNYGLAIGLDKSDPVPYYMTGKIYQTQDNFSVFTDYYNNAIHADPLFGLVYYQLYYYYYTRDPKMSLDNLQKFIANSDPNPRNDYLLADMYYTSKKYPEAIDLAKKIIATEKEKANPRLYKLLAYSYDATNHPGDAQNVLKHYFETASDTAYAPADFELMARVVSADKQDSTAVVWYEKALQLQKDTLKKVEVAKKIMAYYKSHKQYDRQAYWFDQLHSMNTPFNNVDLFNWGIAHYNAKNYIMADSIFGMYEQKYPQQSFGYYWRARTNAAMDTAMESGIAVPHYESLIAVASKDTANVNNKKWLIQAYGYVAAFKVNKEKQYNDALTYYDRILELDPGNDDAEKYKEILGKMITSKAADSQKNN